jgi:sugar phosphate isomerase/epimerase
MGQRRISLEYLTALDASPPRLIELAAENGVPLVSLPVVVAADRTDWGLIGDTPSRRETLRRCAATGVRVDVVEAFFLRPDTKVAAFEAALASGAELGAARVVMLAQIDDLQLRLEQAHRFCDLAERCGLSVLLEYTPRMSYRTVEEAAAFIEALGRPGLLIEADCLHTFRGGSSLASLRSHRARIGRAQLNDGPRLIAAGDGRHEAVAERRIPGEGELPLTEFIRALPEDIVIGVEVPQSDAATRGVDAAARVRAAVAGTRRALEAAAS